MKKKSFTFIEMIVVISIVSLVIPSIFAIIFAILREQVKIVRMSIVKREGDYALNLITNTIRNNALSVHTDHPVTDSNEICKTANNQATPSAYPLFFKNKTGDWFGYGIISNKISSYSSYVIPTITVSPTSAFTSLELTSLNTSIQNFLIGCSNSYAYGLPVVSISFDICYKTSSGDCVSSRPEEIVNLHYQTKIRLRNMQ